MNWEEARDTIRASVQLADVVAKYTTLHPSGNKLKGLSPFTNEKTPSFFVDPTGNVYYCFSSHKGGDLFSFVQEMEGLDFKGAMRFLADMAGISLDASAQPPLGRTPAAYKILEDAKALYQKSLNTERLAELRDRGLTQETIEKWELGYAPDTWNTLCTKTLENPEEHRVVGMCIKTERGMYDRFRNRLMFPFHDEQGRIIGFSGRACSPTDTAKYVNSPDSPLFDKSVFLYGLYFAKQHIRRADCVMLTEGQFDTVLAHQAGYPIAVATSGTAVTLAHLQRLYVLSHNLLLALDADPAGIRATFKVLGMALSIGFNIKIVTLPVGQDPADIVKDSATEFAAYVKAAKPVTTFAFDHITKEAGENQEDRIRVAGTTFFPLLAQCVDPLIKEHMTQAVAEYLKLDVAAIRDKLSILNRQAKDVTLMRKIESRVSTASPVNALQKYLKEMAYAEVYLRATGYHIPEKEVARIQSAKEKAASFPEAASLPDVSEELAHLRYEEFSDNERQEKVFISLKEALKVLDNELHRYEQLRRLE